MVDRGRDDCLFVLIFVPLRLYRRGLERRFATDPAGARAYSERAQKRLFRWAKWDGLLLAAMLLGLLVLVIVLAATGARG